MFRRALSETPDDPRSTVWRVELAAIERRWSASAYALLRANGGSTLAAAPVLGGGQSGAQIGYSLDPLAKRPFEIVGRLTTPNSDARSGAQAAFGLTWRLSPAFSISGERLFALGNNARSAWTARAAGGAATTRDDRTRWLDASVYGEAGLVGTRDAAVYGALQGRAGRAATLPGNVVISAGAGAWGSVQHERRTASRFEIGPTARLRVGRIEAAVDYRWRVAGNAAPGSGPALTLAAYY